ncbi:MAG: NAD-dependent epimerase/dehydratase family protein [Rhodospirillaceae bacterium]|nr:NAD-dependent epimerase/dehydratase family protein [Rhodospirillaceae bacterium]
MTRALITGGAGFIGLHLARALVARNMRVDLLDVGTPDPADADLAGLLASGRAALVVGDIRDGTVRAGLAGGYDLVFHLAARLGVAAVASAPYQVLAENIETTMAALDLARGCADLQRFVFASTSEVYGGAQEHLDLPIPTPEDALLALPDLSRPRTSYMLSKIYGEALTQHSGLPFTIIRPHNVYGPRMGLRHVIPELLKRAHTLPAGQAMAVYSTEHTRTFCFVEDAVQLILQAATVPAGLNATVNIGAQAPELAMGALGRLVLDVVGRTAEIDPQPATAGSPARRCPDMARCTAITGLHAQVSLEDGVRRTYDWYRTHVFDRPSHAPATPFRSAGESA